MVLNNFFRYFIQVLTLLFTLMGVAMAVYGYLSYTAHMHHFEIENVVHTVAFAFLSYGTFCAVLNLIGLLGGIFQNKCLLITFCTFMVILIIFEIMGLVSGFTVDHEEAVEHQLRSSLRYYDDEKDLRKFWDAINKNFNCCGVESASDWGENIPNSCCKDLDINDVCHKELANERGCLFGMVNSFRSYAPIFVTIYCGLQLSCVVFAICLMRVRRETV